MIGRITGIIIYKGLDHVVVDVHGVGFEIFLSDRALTELAPIGKQVSIFTELIVREDLLQLVGFLTVTDREWYRLLTGVQGVGSKAALKILGTITTKLISRAILTEDVGVIKATPGIGPKIAKRIVSELKDKTASLIAGSQGLEPKPTGKVKYPEDTHGTEKVENWSSSDEELKVMQVAQEENSQIQSEAVSALSNLGYSTLEAVEAINEILTDEKSQNLEELIKGALKRLAGKG
mgnify:FL=1